MNKNNIMALASLAAMPMSAGATERPNVIIIQGTIVKVRIDESLTWYLSGEVVDAE